MALPRNGADSTNPEKPAKPAGSVTLGVISNWIWYTLVALSGFVVPRLVAEQEGKSVLGIWDLGWSLLFFVSFLQFGATGAVNRFVSRYRTTEDWPSLNSSVNCCLLLLSAGALACMAIAVAIITMMPGLFSSIDGQLVGAAQNVVLLLAAAAAIQMPFSVFNSIITGYGRFELLNLIRGGKDAIVLVAMVLLLMNGMGIVSVAWSVCLGEILCGVGLVVVSRGLCPQLRIAPSFISRKMLRKVLAFGGKSMSRGVSRALLYQVNSIIVATVLGPATLAVYQRQRNLVMQVMKFVKQYAQVFIPVSSEMDARGDTLGLQRIMIESGRWGMYVTAPMMALLIFLGGPIVRLWMGPGFESPAILAVLAFGHLFSVAQLGQQSVLEGMGRHGWPALMELITAIVGVLLTLLLTSVFGFGAMGAAISVALAVGITTGIVLPIYACRLVGLGLWRYFHEAWARPLLVVSPALIWLFVVAQIWSQDALRASLFGTVGTGIIVAAMCWRFALPMELRRRICAKLPGLGGLARNVGPTVESPIN